MNYFDEKTTGLLVKVFMKASNNGWKLFRPRNENDMKFSIEKIIYPAGSLLYLIFSHDFAKAFWGEGWKKYLQKMVLEENYLKYLEGFLNNQGIN